MGQIRVSPETLRTRSRDYMTGANDVRTVLSNLTRTQEMLATEWEGQAFQKFAEQFNQLSPKVRDFADLLEQIYKQLTAAANAMENHDKELSTKFGLN